MVDGACRSPAMAVPDAPASEREAAAAAATTAAARREVIPRYTWAPRDERARASLVDPILGSAGVPAEERRGPTPKTRVNLRWPPGQPEVNGGPSGRRFYRPGDL